MTEGLRSALTPQLPHIPAWGSSLGLSVGSVLLAAVSLRTFMRRVVT
jgi:ABC-2 type transport system permease protein